MQTTGAFVGGLDGNLASDLRRGDKLLTLEQVRIMPECPISHRGVPLSTATHRGAILNKLREHIKRRIQALLCGAAISALESTSGTYCDASRCFTRSRKTS